MFAPVRRFFPEQRQRLNGGWRRARVLHPSEDLSELPPLRSVVAGQEYHCPRTRSLRGSLPKLLLDGWVPLVTFLGRLYTAELYRWSSRIRQIAFPRRVLPTDVLLNRIFTFQRTAEVNVPLFNPTENRVLTSHFFKNFLIFFFAHWMDSKAALYPQFSAFAMS